MEPEMLSATVALYRADHAVYSGCGRAAPAVPSVLAIAAFLTRQHQSGRFVGGCHGRPILIL